MRDRSAVVALVAALTLASCGTHSSSSVGELEQAGSSRCGTATPVVQSIVATPPSPQVGTLVTLTATVTDADNSCGPPEVFKYAWRVASAPSGSTASLSSSSAASPTFTPDLPGAYTIELVVTDGAGHVSAPKSLAVTATAAPPACGTAPPVIAATSASTASPNLGDVVGLTATVTDADNASPCSAGQTFRLTWTLVAKPFGSELSLEPVTLEALGVRPDVAGTYRYDVVATDSTGRSSEPATVQFYTRPCGAAPPSIAAIAPSTQTPMMGDAVRLVPTVRDPDNDPSCNLGQTFTYAWSIVTRPATSTAVPLAPSDPSPMLLLDAVGTYEVELIVTDSTGRSSAPAYATIRTSACGTFHPFATVTPAPAGAAVHPLDTVRLATVVTDGDITCGLPEVFTYSWQLTRPPGSAALILPPGDSSPSVVPDLVGTYVAELVVYDTFGNASTPAAASFTVGCDAPVLASTPFVAGDIHPGDQVPLVAALTSGAPGCPARPLSWSWAIVGRPAGSTAALDFSSSERPIFLADVPGMYTIGVRVQDATGRSATETQAVQVTPCVQLAFNDLVTDVDANTWLTLSSRAVMSCPREPALQPPVRWTVLAAPKGGQATVAATDGWNAAFRADTAGTYLVRAAVEAIPGGELTRDVQVQVSMCGTRGPTIQAIEMKDDGTGQPVSRPFIGQQVRLTAEGADEDLNVCPRESLSYAWTLVSVPAGSTVAPPNSLVPQWSFAPDRPGDYVFEVVALDAYGLRSPPYRVQVQPAPCGPTHAPLAALTAIAGQWATLTVSDVKDICFVPADPTGFSYEWTLRSRPVGSDAQLEDVTSATPRLLPDVPGDYEAGLVIRDAAGYESRLATMIVHASDCGSAPPGVQLQYLIHDPELTAPLAIHLGARVELTAQVTDPNTDCGVLDAPFTYRWTLVSRPSGSEVALAAGDATPSLFPDVPGQYQVALTVSNARGIASEPAYLTMNTSKCSSSDAPILVVASNPPFVVGEPVELRGELCPPRFSQPESATLEWAVISKPPSAVASVLPANDPMAELIGNTPGNYVIQLRAVANNLDVATSDVTIELVYP
jgi:PKD repeat protein